MRAEFQVLIIPFIKDENGSIKYAVFRRKDNKNWQFIAGGGEDTEKPPDAAKRETKEEANITSDDFFILKTKTMIPITEFDAHRNKKGLYVIPEYCFGVKINSLSIDISNEHTEFKIVEYDDAVSLLQYDGNKTALWELNERIKEGDLKRAY
ncbi:MAG: NUDIX pyrophosphatase [Candidatus Eremiobacteraeota bacterium]|nr:NUDIX pyrophosphatase [Candidatus Eremiobacteraeota bacterium]